MANPAELLHKQLKAWSNTNGTSPQTQRKMNKSETEIDAWAKHRRCVTYLNQIEDCLLIAKDRGIDVSVYEAHFLDWVKAVWVYPHGWSSGNPAVLKSPMEHLQNLSALLNMVVPTFKDDENKKGFEQFLRVTLRHIDELDDSHEALKSHAKRVIRHLIGCMKDVEILGEFNIFNALQELQEVLDDLKKAAPRDSFFTQAASGFWTFFKEQAVRMLPFAFVTVAAGALNAGGEDFYQLVKSEWLEIEAPSEDQSMTESQDSDSSPGQSGESDQSPGQ